MSPHRPNDPAAKPGENLLREPLPWLVVGAILFCLWGGTPWSGGGLHQGTKAKVQAATTQIEQFREAVQLYARDNGAPPSATQGLDALIHRPTKSPRPKHWKKCLEDLNEIPKDPWGNEYLYQSPGPRGERFSITSLGADGRPGGHGNDADITSGPTDGNGAGKGDQR